MRAQNAASHLSVFPDEGAAPSASIGPNAILQTAHALRAHGGAALERAVFMRAGLPRYLKAPPAAMICEREAMTLFRAIYDETRLTRADADAIMRDAGQRTGDYILAHRIPQQAQRLLKLMPKTLAARVLLKAIAGHAWTFAGSGRVTCYYGRLLAIEIEANPLAAPGCHWHCGVFARLFGALVSERVDVRHTNCSTTGAPTCRFEIRC